MEPASRLDEYLKELHLPTIRSRYGNAAEQAAQEGLSYERYLLEAGRARIRSPPPAPHRAAGAGSRLPLDKNLATLTLGRLPRESAAAVWGVARRAVPGPQGERARFR